ncbi:glycosyl hydrolase family 76 [Colletotrichum truncatum]|uniref:Glycosyl hydrolase family 76 n=1 Tax=Colletotrichum truncatum TaxID=5467 RepID=A0ACC3Z335_COLTU|nr:glycosyl hydrolase family 76 [Colletotrichum truncatum]KAF6793203.1 glycosyl hydrolase family 76 [Colletotrichum truncatum]
MAASLVSTLSGALLLFGSLPGASAELKIGSRDEIVKSSGQIAKDLFTVYQGDKPGAVPGLLPGPPTDGKGDFYWIHGASFFSTYLDYQHWTGDDSYQASIIKALTHQVGPRNDYLPPNITATVGNDDQCFWGSAALLAAEYQLPKGDGIPAWIDVAKNVWETQASPDRHDDTCDGGLRWQIPPSNNGYNWKQTTSNGCFLSMGARLARFTGNATYAEYAEKTWDWLNTVGFIDNKTSAVYDGAHTETNCTDISKIQFSVNAAILTEGAAFMYNFTNGSDVWRQRTEKLADSLLKTFFPKGIAYEVACESEQGRCTIDHLFMKGYLHRWLSVATQVAPFLSEKVLPVLKSSAEAAAKHCQGDAGATTCSFYWSEAQFVDPKKADDSTGVAERSSALSAISGLLIKDAKAPVTEKTGGSSSSGNSASSGSATGSAAGASGSASPATAPSAAGNFGVNMKMSLLVSALAAFAWAL